MKRWALRILLALVIVYVAFVGVTYAAMTRGTYTFSQYMMRLPQPLMMLAPFPSMWTMARAGTVNPGDEAPAFDLERLDRSSRVALAQHKGVQPVVLVFGSYTCPPFRRGVPSANSVYHEFKDRVAFYLIYIEEAHATDMWQTASNLTDKVLVPTPRSFDERVGIAASCIRSLKLDMPALVDNLDNSTERAYTAWPDRLYLIDTNGHVVWKSKPGPFGFDPSLLRNEINALLAAR